jgi:hypothetical protein
MFGVRLAVRPRIHFNPFFSHAGARDATASLRGSNLPDAQTEIGDSVRGAHRDEEPARVPFTTDPESRWSRRSWRLGLPHSSPHEVGPQPRRSTEALIHHPDGLTDTISG